VRSHFTHFGDNFRQYFLTNQVVIFGRSLKIHYSGHLGGGFSKCRDIFKRLVEEGVLKNNCELSVSSCSKPHIPWLLGSICFMEKLDRLEFNYFGITLEQLSTLFRSCPELVELDVELDVGQKLEMDDCLKNDLRRGFQKLKILSFQCYIDNDSWPAIKEIVT
jgi:hypothetical protein